MQYDAESFSKLLNESKDAISPLKMKRSELALILSRQKMSFELIYELEEIAESQGVIMAQIGNDFLFVSNWNDCDSLRVYKERYSEKELAECQDLAEARFAKLWETLRVDTSDYPALEENKEALIDLLEDYMGSVQKLLLKLPSSLEGTLDEFFSDMELIKSGYSEFMSSQHLDSDDLECDLREFDNYYDNYSHDDLFDSLPAKLLVNVGITCEEPPINEYYLCFNALFGEIGGVVSRINENYYYLTDIRKGLYADKVSAI